MTKNEKQIRDLCAKRGLTIYEYEKSVEIRGTGVHLFAASLAGLTPNDIAPWFGRKLQP